MRVEFRTLDGVEERGVLGTGHGCVEVVVNGHLGGYLIRDLPEDTGGRWFATRGRVGPRGRGFKRLASTALS